MIIFIHELERKTGSWSLAKIGKTIVQLFLTEKKKYIKKCVYGKQGQEMMTEVTVF